MQTQDLRKVIENAIDANWQQFQTNHPRLAAVIDRDLLIEEAQRQLDRDPEYQAALVKAQLVGQAGDYVQQLAVQLIDKLLTRVMGA